MIKHLILSITIVFMSGCVSLTSFTKQTLPMADQQLMDPDKALIIVKRKIENSRSAVAVEITDNGQSVGVSGIQRQEGQPNNWLIWERPSGEMRLQTVSKFGVADRAPFIESVKAGVVYEYMVIDASFSGLMLKKLW